MTQPELIDPSAETSSEVSGPAPARDMRPSGSFYFLRYGFVAWAGLLTVMAEVFTMLQRGMQWRGDLIWTVDWLPVSFVIVGPIVAGFAAMDTARTASGARHLFQNRVTRTPAFAVWLSYAVALLIIHSTVLAVALVVSRPVFRTSMVLLAVLCQVLMLALFVAVGTLIGRFVGLVSAGISAAVSVLATVYLLSAPGDHLNLLEIGGATIPRIGYVYNGRFLLIQALGLVLLLIAALIPRPMIAGDKSRPSLRDASAAVSLVLVALGVAFSTPSERLARVSNDHGS